MKRATFTLGIAAVCLVTAAMNADAQARVATQPGGRRAPAGAAATGRITRLGTADAFYRRLQNLEDVRKMGGDPAVQKRVAQVMDQAGLTGLTAQVLAALSSPDAQRMNDVRIDPGTRMEWMAFRERTRARLQRPAEWAGRQPFEAWRFTIEDGGNRYNFLLPKACGNLALLNREAVPPPPPPPAAVPDDTAERQRRDQEARERAERERQEAERRRAEEEQRVKQAEEAKRAEEQRERERLEQERLARLARERVDWFVAGFGGKERRVRDQEVFVDGTAVTVANGQCAGLIGAKGGLDIRLSPSWRFAPGVGVAFNTEEGDNTSLFADAEFNYQLTRGYVGTGIGVWDFTHSDTVAATWLVHGGVELMRQANDNRLFLAIEGRFFLNEFDDTSNNYQFWGGLRYVVR